MPGGQRPGLASAFNTGLAFAEIGFIDKGKRIVGLGVEGLVFGAASMAVGGVAAVDRGEGANALNCPSRPDTPK